MTSRLQKKREHKRKRRLERRHTQVEARKHTAITAPNEKIAPPRLAALSAIDPSRIIKDPSDKVGIFFLMLSVVFNDIKDLFELTLSVQAAIQTAPELDRHELRGRHTMLHRFIAGALHELMTLISNERTVLDESEFKHAAKRLAPLTADLWKSIVNIALAKNSADGLDSATKRALAIVRNNVSFHYASLESMAEAWESLKTRGKGQGAPYSMGRNTPETRFHYADAVLQKMMDRAAGRFLKDPDPSFDKLFLDIAQKTHLALASLLHAFLDNRSA